MTTSTQYVQELISSLIGKFPNARARYDYDADSDTHTIEVVPGKIYHNDEQFEQWQGEAIINFIDRYPFESICFVTDDSVLGLDKYQHEYVGMFYDRKPKHLIYDNYVPEIFHENLMKESLTDLIINSIPQFDHLQDFKFFSAGKQYSYNTCSHIIYPVNKGYYAFYFQTAPTIRCASSEVPGPIVPDPDNNIVKAA